MSNENNNEFTWPVRVYYEDTDAGGIVYHARYLHFLERARTEWLRDKGFNQSALKEKDCVFVVRDMQIKFVKPAMLDDELMISVSIDKIKPASMRMTQTITKKQTVLLKAEVTVACLKSTLLSPMAIPDFIVNTLQSPEGAVSK